MAENVSVSVVLPAYNEEATLELAVERSLSALAEFLSPGSYEVIISEDGCTDRTPEIAEALAAGDNQVRHLGSVERLGRGRALERAFRAARGDTLVYFDADLATDLGHLEELIEAVRSGEADVATGSRWMPGREAERPPGRRVPSRVYNRLVRLALQSSVRDHQCGFKAFDREVLLSLLPAVHDDHWFWDTEVLVRAQRAGHRVHEFPVEWTPMEDTKVDFVRDVLGMGGGVVRTWWELSVSPRITPRRSIAAGVLLTLAAVALMTLYLDVSAVIAGMGTAARRNPALVAAAALVYLASWPLRGARYRDILAELGYREHVGFLTGAVFISQTGNLVFPARAGDAVRAYVVKVRRGIPYASGFASLAVERVFDLLTIGALAGTVLVALVVAGGGVTLPGVEAAGAAARSGRTAVTVAGAVGVAALAAVVAIVATAHSERNRVREVVARLSDDSYAAPVAETLERFVGDVQTVAAHPGAFARVSATSLVIWSIDVATAALVLAAFEPGLSSWRLAAVCLLAVSVGNLAKVLPLSPGGIGLYEGAFTLLVVGVTGVPAALALGAAIVDHAIKNAITVVGGVVSMLVLNVSLTTAAEAGREVHTETEAD